MNIDDGPDLEDRYRRVLRLLPGYYRDRWEEDMVAAYLDSRVTGDEDEDEYIVEFGRPAWPEVASVAALAARLYLGGAGAPRRYFAWGQAVRRAVLAVVLVHAVQGLSDLTLLAWRRHLAGWLPALPASLAGPVPGGFWPTVANTIGCAWIVIFVVLVLGHHRTARVIAVLAIAADLLLLLQAQLDGNVLRPLGSWSSFILFDFTPVLAMAAFHRDAPPAARRPWLLALPGYCLLVPVLVAGPDAARRCRRGVADRLARRLPARPAPGQREPGGTAHPGSRRRAGRPRRRPRPAGRARTATASAPGMSKRPPTERTQDMPFQPPPRPASVLASVLAAGLMLTAASCSHITPLGPAAPQPSQLRSPFALEALGIQAPAPAGGCPAGSVALSGGSGQCYRPLGAPVTITSAAISPVSAIPQNHPPGTAAGPPAYGFMVTLPASETPALTAVTTTAADSRGYLGITVAGRTWLLPQVTQPFPGPRFQVFMPGKNQVLQLQRILASSG